MKKLYYALITGLYVTLLLFNTWQTAMADSLTMLTLPNPATYPPIVISEMQPGSATSASQEFIELYNQSPNAINLTSDGWQLQIASSTAGDWSKTKNVLLTGIFYPGTYYLLASSYVAAGDTKTYLQDYANAQFSSGLTASAGHIRLANKATLASTKPSEDSLEWSTQTSNGADFSPPIDGLGMHLSADISPGSSLKRKTDSHGYFMSVDSSGNTNGATNTSPFLVSPCPSPTANDVAPTVPNPDVLGPLATSIDITNPACIPPPSDEGSTSPVTPPTTIPPAILLPDDFVAPSVPQALIPQADYGLEAPQLTELLPNPAAPQTDSHDEFIELYNGNQTAFDLSGFMLTSGTNTLQRYIFPIGTSLPAQSFTAFYAWQTGLGMSNSAGQVRLYDSLGNLLGQTTNYDTAKDGWAWVFAAGTWQWTDMPSPGNTNTIHLPKPKGSTAATVATTITKKPSQPAKAAAKTVTDPKTKAAKKTVTSTKNSSNVLATPSQATTSLHMPIIAFMAGCAVLYGAYEYRHDLASRIYQLRSYREARRAFRQSDQRWRGD